MLLENGRIGRVGLRRVGGEKLRRPIADEAHRRQFGHCCPTRSWSTNEKKVWGNIFANLRRSEKVSKYRQKVLINKCSWTSFPPNMQTKELSANWTTKSFLSPISVHFPKQTHLLLFSPKTAYSLFNSQKYSFLILLRFLLYVLFPPPPPPTPLPLLKFGSPNFTPLLTSHCRSTQSP